VVASRRAEIIIDNELKQQEMKVVMWDIHFPCSLGYVKMLLDGE
jgi:hypothetical protein